jgi:hypothetical protein
MRVQLGCPRDVSGEPRAEIGNIAEPPAEVSAVGAMVPVLRQIQSAFGATQDDLGLRLTENACLKHPGEHTLGAPSQRKQGLEGVLIPRFEPEAFARREVCREDDLLGCPCWM